MNAILISKKQDRIKDSIIRAFIDILRRFLEWLECEFPKLYSKTKTNKKCILCMFYVLTVQFLILLQKLIHEFDNF